MVKPNLNAVSALDASKLDQKQINELADVLTLAKKDKYLDDGNEGVVREGEKRIAILYGKTVIGFYSPKRQNWLDTVHWRAGALFLLPTYRSKGIMEFVLQTFFSKHAPGLTWIDDSNTPSIRLFSKLGFKQDKQRNGSNGDSGHWYLLKLSVASTMESITKQNKLLIKKLHCSELSHFITSEILKNKEAGIIKDEDDLLYLEPEAVKWTDTWGCYYNGKLSSYLIVPASNPHYCDKLYVSPSVRRTGVAKFMLDELDITSVSVMRQNTTAMCFYIACGFKEISHEYNLCLLTRKRKQKSYPTLEKRVEQTKPVFLKW